jgi:uncharacterized protein (UPF0147 family)
MSSFNYNKSHYPSYYGSLLSASTTTNSNQERKYIDFNEINEKKTSLKSNEYIQSPPAPQPFIKEINVQNEKIADEYTNSYNYEKNNSELVNIFTIEPKNIHQNSKYLLDPLSVIVKLAILSKKSVGCKICIYNNVMYIQEPGIFQPFVRYIYKNNKNDLNYLYNPIEFACSRYFNDYTRPLFIHAKKGIEFLIEKYKDTNIIVHTLYMYYNIIVNYINLENKKNLFINDRLTYLYSEEFTNGLYEKWNKDKIKMVLDIIEFIDKDKTVNKNVKCLEEFMTQIDNDTRLYITEYFTNKNKNK